MGNRVCEFVSQVHRYGEQQPQIGVPERGRRPLRQLRAVGHFFSEHAIKERKRTAYRLRRRLACRLPSLQKGIQRVNLRSRADFRWGLARPLRAATESLAHGSVAAHKKDIGTRSVQDGPKMHPATEDKA